MSQNDYIIADDSGAAVLADMSAAFQALASHNIGTTAPTTKYQGMTWIDSSATPWVLKRWDGSSWISEALIDATAHISLPYIGNYPINDDRFKNRLKNGDMFIDQPKTTHASGAEQTFTAGAGWAHAVDLWQAACTGGNVTGQQQAGEGGFRNAYKFTGGAGCTGVFFCQRIPAEDIMDLASSPMMLSARMRSSGEVTVTWKAYYADAANDFTTRTQFATGTFETTAVLTAFSAAVTMHASVVNGVEIEFSIGAFTSGTWTITGVQLERGSQMTMFEMLPPTLALLECQRQYVVIDEAGQVPVTSAYGLWPIPFPTTMRATPGAVEVITAGTASNCGVQSEVAPDARGCTFGVLSTAANGYVTGRVVGYSALL